MSRVVDLGALPSSGFSGFIVQGDSAGDKAGFSVSAVGDFNGDGFDDFVLGAPLNDSDGANSGAAYLIYGHASGFAGIDLSNLPSADGFRIQGDRAGDTAGIDVSGAGDINGDGFDDLLVAATSHGLLGYGIEIKAYVIFGRAAEPAGLDLTGLAASDGFVLTGPFASHYGGSVSAAGDVNGDGFADIIIGAPFGGIPAAGPGSAYVIFGKATGFSSMDLGDLGANGFLIHGNTDLFNVGESVSSAGDVNGDGFDDIIVTAARNGFYHYGSTPSAYVIFGKASGFGTVDLSNLSASDGFQIKGSYSYGNYSFSVAGAGDVNGDGFADMILGRAYDNGRAGAAYVVFGKANGFGTIDVANLAPSAGFVIHGGAAQDLAGLAIAAAGDVNGDGIGDLIVGAPLADGGGMNAGDAYVIFGRTTGFGTVDLANLAPTAGFIIQGDAADDRAGFSVSGAGDLNGDGFADLIVGAPYGDMGGTDAGQVYAVLGAGTSAPDVREDFNGDGRSDLMWRDSNGTMSEWLGQLGGSFQWNPHAAFQVGTDLSMQGFGDFNGDGRDDILWRQDGTGTAIEWLGQANGGFAWNANFSPPVTDQFVGTGDFNGDGRDDIMWRDASGTLSEWLGQTNGGFQWNAPAAFHLTTDWSVAGTGDVNGDGRDDLIWRQDATGKVMEWLAQANGGFAWNVNYDLPTSFHLAGVGDFDGDGHDDLLWRDANGTLSEWLGQGTGGFHWNALAAFSVANTWQVAGTGDYNGDGRDDILWRTDTGQLLEWLARSNGAFVGNQAVQYDVGAGFHSQPPGDHFL